MELEHFQSEWGDPERCSAAVRAGDLIWTCGQLGTVPGADAIDFATEVETALRQLLAVVEDAGGNLETIVKINAYIADIDDFPVYDRVYRAVIMRQPMPPRTTVQIGRFLPPIRVEVDAVAVVNRVAGEL